MSTSKKELYSKGLCYQCESPLEDLSKKTCEKCRKEYQTNRNIQRNIQLDILFGKGLCRCGEPLEVLTRKSCNKCSKKFSEQGKARKQHREQNGLCVVCGQPKEDLSKYSCNKCLDKHNREVLVVQAQRRDENKCTHCGVHIGKTGYCEKCLKYSRDKDLELKLEAFNSYGGIFCQCCKENTHQLLTLDHINRDGAEDRKTKGSGDKLYRYLRKNNFPPGFRVLCFNCNGASYYCDGICPHQKNIPVPQTDHYKLKQKLLDIYGNSCICCSESDVRFLTLDHINNNGGSHRKDLKSRGGVTFYRWAFKNLPDDLQVSCMSCNSGRHINGGVCPHQTDKSKIVEIPTLPADSDLIVSTLSNSEISVEPPSFQ